MILCNDVTALAKDLDGQCYACSRVQEESRNETTRRHTGTLHTIYISAFMTALKVRSAHLYDQTSSKIDNCFEGARDLGEPTL